MDRGPLAVSANRSARPWQAPLVDVPKINPVSRHNPSRLDEDEALSPALSFDDFYRAHFRRVLALAYALTGSRWAAEDLAQEAFLAAHRKWDRVRQYDRGDLWIRRVATNLAVSRVRRRIAEAKSLLKLATSRPASVAPVNPADAEVWREVRALPVRQAQALVLRYVDDRSVRDIAEILGCAEGTVKAHLSRGRAALAARLGPALAAEEHET